jgi:hypothetical protein
LYTLINKELYFVDMNQNKVYFTSHVLHHRGPLHFRGFNGLIWMRSCRLKEGLPFYNSYGKSVEKKRWNVRCLARVCVYVCVLFKDAFSVEYCVELKGRVPEQKQTARNLEVSIRGLNSLLYRRFSGGWWKQRNIPAGVVDTEAQIPNEPLIRIDLQQHLYASPSGLDCHLHCTIKIGKYRKERDYWELFCF